MSKVQITQEQLGILNTYINTHGKDGTIDMHKYWCGDADCLNDLKYSEIAKVLYTEDYEVVPELKIGDYVFCTNKEKQKSIGKITSITGMDGDVYVVKFEDIGLVERFVSNRLRHATPEEIEQEKERRWWAEHGRDVWDLVVGDILIDKRINSVDIFKGFNLKGEAVFELSMDQHMYFVKKYSKVICFAEDRKDI